MGSYLGVKGVEHGLKVQSELVEGFFRVGNGSVSHSVVPGFGIRGPSSISHLVQGGHDLGSIGRVEGRV